MNPRKKFIESINKDILPNIDYDKLQRSYDTEDMAYAKTVLYFLNKAAVEAYGSEHLMCHGDLDYALLPGVIQSKGTGRICLALLGIDLDSSGEHCETSFLTCYGIVDQTECKSNEARAYMNRQYSGGYQYAYTFTVHGDIHVSNNDMPPAIRNFLATYKECAAKTVVGAIKNEESDKANEMEELYEEPEGAEEDEEDLEP